MKNPNSGKGGNCVLGVVFIDRRLQLDHLTTGEANSNPTEISRSLKPIYVEVPVYCDIQ